MTDDALPVLRAAVRHDARAARAPTSRSRRATDFPANAGRAVPEGLDRGRAADHAGPAHHPAGPRRRRAARRRPGTTRSTSSPTGIAGIQAEHGPDAVAVFGGGGLTNEKAYQLGKFARVALRHQPDRLQRPVLHVLGRGRREPGVRHRPRPAVPARRPRPRPTRSCWSGGNLAETMPPFVRHLDRQRGRGGRLIVVDPRRTADRRAGPTCTCSRRPAPTSRWPSGCCTSSSPRGCVDEAYVAARTTGFDAVRTVGRRLVAGAGRADHRRAGGRRMREAVRAARRGATGRVVLTARGRRAARQGHRHGHRVHQPGARARACPAAPGSGYGCLTGQGNGQGGREHGQKADQLPGYRQDRRPGGPRARRRRLGRRRRTTCPGPGRSAYELLDALGTAGGPARAAGVRLQPGRLRAATPARVAERLAALDLLVVADFVLSETAALADVVLPSPSGPRRPAR